MDGCPIVELGDPNNLEKHTLAKIVSLMQDFLFVTETGIDPDKDVNGGDFVEVVAALLAAHNLTPSRPQVQKIPGRLATWDRLQYGTLDAVPPAPGRVRRVRHCLYCRTYVYQREETETA